MGTYLSSIIKEPSLGKNSVDPNQTTSKGAVWSGSALFAINLDVVLCG